MITKFRAWVKRTVVSDWDSERMIYNTIKVHESMKEVKSIHFGTEEIIISCNYGNKSVAKEDYTLMQYTEIKDINGKEIYQSDIVNVTYGASHKHLSGKNFVVTKYPGYFGITPLCPMHHYKRYIEVVGNIYENPELIGDKHENMARSR